MGTVKKKKKVESETKPLTLAVAVAQGWGDMAVYVLEAHGSQHHTDLGRCTKGEPVSPARHRAEGPTDKDTQIPRARSPSGWAACCLGPGDMEPLRLRAAVNACGKRPATGQR